MEISSSGGRTQDNQKALLCLLMHGDTLTWRVSDLDSGKQKTGLDEVRKFLSSLDIYALGCFTVAWEFFSHRKLIYR